MANPQPSDAHGIIAHDIQDNIIIRDFTELQLKILYSMKASMFRELSTCWNLPDNIKFLSLFLLLAPQSMAIKLKSPLPKLIRSMNQSPLTQPQKKREKCFVIPMPNCMV